MRSAALVLALLTTSCGDGKAKGDEALVFALTHSTCSQASDCASVPEDGCAFFKDTGVDTPCAIYVAREFADRLQSLVDDWAHSTDTGDSPCNCPKSPEPTCSNSLCGPVPFF